MPYLLKRIEGRWADGNQLLAPDPEEVTDVESPFVWLRAHGKERFLIVGEITDEERSILIRDGINYIGDYRPSLRSLAIIARLSGASGLGVA